jgi:uncharacterized membrane protein YraQ (UPF0718 family)
MKRNTIFGISILSGYTVFLIVAWIVNFAPGKEITLNLGTFALFVIKLLPCAFILIGLFQVWVRKEMVERHLGEGSGIRGYVWGILLSFTTVGGIFVALPVSYSLYSKGARLSAIFTYIGASAICRIPMAIFEASFLGIKFTAIRLMVSIPLVILTSMILRRYLTKRSYQITQPG